MNKCKNSIYAFGIYLLFIGILLIAIPNTLLPIFGFKLTTDVWIRVLGMVLFFLSWFYFTAAKFDWVEFYKVSVMIRISILAFFIGFVILGLAPWTLILFGLVDAATGIWTGYTLKTVR